MSRRSSFGAFVKDIRAFLLAVLFSVISFLMAQLVLNNAAYGYPLLIPIVILFVFREANLIWNIATSVSTILIFLLLYLIFPDKNSTQPVFILLIGASLILTAAISGINLSKTRKQQRIDKHRKFRDQMIADINTQLLTASTSEELYKSTLRYLHIVTQRSMVFFTYQQGCLALAASYPPGLIVYSREADYAMEAYLKRMPVGTGTPHEVTTSFLYLPVISDQKSVAVVGVLFDSSEPPEKSMIETLQLILVRVGVALEKHRLFKDHQLTLLDKELERVRSDFLRSVSHDFRTPLTGIIGACSVLNETKVILEKSDQYKLIKGIADEAGWLLRMVENLLSITRVGVGRLSLRKNLEPLEEILMETMIRVKKRFPNSAFQILQPDELTLIPADPLLIIQVLMNLIENAVKYSSQQEKIVLTVKNKGTYLSFSLRDYGSGMSEEVISTLFQDSIQKVDDFSHGMGLGLSICKSIIEAHGGKITGKNSPDGVGAIFTFTLPLEEKDYDQESTDSRG